MEDQDRKTPEEEKEVEAHFDSMDPEPLDPEASARDDDDFEAHALRDPEPLDPEASRAEDKDPEGM